MSEDLSTALVLLGVGMITVFLVLSLVVIVGHLLISFVNRFLPPAIVVDKNRNKSPEIRPSQIAAITAAVEVFTRGKGRIVSIKKTENHK